MDGCKFGGGEETTRIDGGLNECMNENGLNLMDERKENQMHVSIHVFIHSSLPPILLLAVSLLSQHG